MAIGYITATEARSEVSDFSYSYQEEKFGLLSQKPFSLPKWKAILSIFQLEVWFGILMSCFIFGPILYIFLQVAQDGIGLGLLACIFQSTKALFMQREKSIPLSFFCAGKIFFF